MNLRFLIPLGVFLALAILLAVGLGLNPREIPSPFIGKPSPGFSLPNLHNAQQTVSHEDFKGKVWLLNVWASWCVSCRQEHPLFNQLSRMNEVTIVGLNYKDQVADAQNWLAQLGNPYSVSVSDLDGRAGIDWGVYGVPETFIIDKAGIVRYKHTGPVSPQDLQQIILPKIRELKGEGA